MERKIGEVFEYHGDKLMVVTDAGCSTCYFGGICYKKQDDPVAGYCSKENRSDSRDVGFQYCGEANPKARTESAKENTEENTGSMKYDAGKPRWELLPLPDIEDIVKVYTFGAQKYAPHSWRQLDKGLERYEAALLRHLTSFQRGEEFDEESGLPALAHMAWNAIAMLAIWNDRRKNSTSHE